MSQIDTWKKRIDKNTRKFVDAFGKLTADELNWKPSEHEWSIAQCIDHIMTTDDNYPPIFEGVKKGTYKAGWTKIIPGYANMMGKMVLKGSSPGDSKKYKTYPVFEPKRSNINEGIIEEFKKNQEDFKSSLELIRDIDLRKTVISSPVNKVAVYSLFHAGEIIVAHQERHFEQAMRVLERLKKSK